MLAIIVFIFQIVLIFITISCDHLERSGKSVINACYIMFEKQNNKEIKELFYTLAEYAEQWRPIFSAAGFFDVNQKCLNNLFSTVVTYLVVFIQFYMMLESSI